ncbi:hypothetical protein CCP3SC15_4530004 [Gammaproteobacteria bacterium]
MPHRASHEPDPKEYPNLPGATVTMSDLSIGTPPPLGAGEVYRRILFLAKP